MLKMEKVSNVFGMKVFTDNGEYFGEIDEAIIQDNKIFGWRIKSTRESLLSKSMGGVKGALVPHQLVKAIKDIMIISKASIPSHTEDETEF